MHCASPSSARACRRRAGHHEMIVAMHVFRGRLPLGLQCPPCPAALSSTAPITRSALKRVQGDNMRWSTLCAQLGARWRLKRNSCCIAPAGLDCAGRASTRGIAARASLRPASASAPNATSMALMGTDGKSSPLRKLVVDGVDDSSVVQVKAVSEFCAHPGALDVVSSQSYELQAVSCKPLWGKDNVGSCRL